MKTQPFYSKLPGIDVYHNNTECTEGNNIEPRYKVEGETGGKRLCNNCETLNRKKVYKGIADAMSDRKQ